MDSDLEHMETQLPCQNGSDSIFCNQSYTFTEYKEVYATNLEWIAGIVVPVLFGIIFVVGILGNVLVLLVVVVIKSMRNVTNLLIANLALADLFFVVFCVPFTATDYKLSYWPFGDLWCKMVQYIIVVTLYAIITSIGIMSVIRFLGVVSPSKSVNTHKVQNTIILLAISWIIIFIACIPVFFLHGVEKLTYGNEEHEFCSFRMESNEFTFHLIIMLTSFVIPLIIICLFYLASLLRIRRGIPEFEPLLESRRQQTQDTRMVVAVIIAFAVCWLPIHVILVIKTLGHYQVSDITIGIQITAHVLAYMNSCVNPILYAFLSENFRKAFCNVILCKINAS